METPEGKCSVCDEVFKAQGKVSRCKECNIVTHVVCSTFVRDPCSRKTLLGRETASCADLPADSPLSEHEEEEYFGLKKSNSLPLDGEAETKVSPKLKAALLKEKTTRSG